MPLPYCIARCLACFLVVNVFVLLLRFLLSGFFFVCFVSHVFCFAFLVPFRFVLFCRDPSTGSVAGVKPLKISDPPMTAVIWPKPCHSKMRNGKCAIDPRQAAQGLPRQSQSQHHQSCSCQGKAHTTAKTATKTADSRQKRHPARQCHCCPLRPPAKNQSASQQQQQQQPAQQGAPQQQQQQQPPQAAAAPPKQPEQAQAQAAAPPQTAGGSGTRLPPLSSRSSHLNRRSSCLATAVLGGSPRASTSNKGVFSVRSQKLFSSNASPSTRQGSLCPAAPAGAEESLKSICAIFFFSSLERCSARPPACFVWRLLPVVLLLLAFATASEARKRPTPVRRVSFVFSTVCGSSCILRCPRSSPFR